MYTDSAYWKCVSSKDTTPFETQKVTIPRRTVKASLFCAIVLALAITPFSGAAGQENGIAVVGHNTDSEPYACTSAGVQKAINDAAAHANGITQSVVDASNCTSIDAAHYTSEIDVSTGTQDATKRIKLILPANGSWTAGINNPNGFAFMWGDGAMVYGGTGSGEGEPFSIGAASGSNLMAVCGNDPANGQYYHVEGFNCSAFSGSTVSYAVLLINGGYDESYVGHMTAASWGAATSRVLWIHAVCCSATFEDINAEAANTANTVPCVLGDLNGALHVSALSCVHPGAGQNAVQILQSGWTNNNGGANSYRDIYVEEGASSDTTTPFIAVKHTGYPYPFGSADLLEGFRAGVDVTNSTTRCMVDIAAGSRVNISNLTLGNPLNLTPPGPSMCAINDRTGANTVTISGAANSVIASYDMTPRYGLTLGAMTVSSLPSAATNAGAMFRVSDSTAITTEGQACVGGGSGNALAFSNGSVWKCF